MSTSATYAWNGRIIAAITSSSSWRSTATASATYARDKRASASTYAWNGGTSATTYARNGGTAATTDDGSIVSTTPTNASFTSWAKTEKEMGSRRPIEES